MYRTRVLPLLTPDQEFNEFLLASLVRGRKAPRGTFDTLASLYRKYSAATDAKIGTNLTS